MNRARVGPNFAPAEQSYTPETTISAGWFSAVADIATRIRLEAALAHTVGGVEGAYFRSDLFERRRRLMDSWATYLASVDTKVVALHR